MKLLLRPQRRDIPEHMDEPGHPPDVLRGALTDLQRLNRWVGGNDLTTRALDRVLETMQPADGPLSVVDVATGGADIPRALLHHCTRSGHAVRITGVDVNDAILEQARAVTPREIELRLGDALQLPFDDRAFDVATCSLMLHHFPPPEALRVLREMARVSRRAVIVNDLLRSWHTYGVARLLARTVTRNELSRFDGPASVLRAYTNDELVTLCQAAGLRPAWRASLLGYRTVLLCTPER